jgi:D-tagatose-1,6-bisphosphate aldolase subunit GatZ/KbaZ
MVLEAAIRFNRERGTQLLVESTANQVNQFGGYTGMQPSDFVSYVRRLAQSLNLDPALLILGGDHLGPLVWHKEPAEQAMQKAAVLVREYVRAGYTKIHLDCSMPLGGDVDLPVALVAERTAFLAQVAETAAADPGNLRYVVGSEVPAAGGAKDAEEQMVITSVESVQETTRAIQFAFEKQGLETAWARVRALVVQPGVEFGDAQVHDYDRQQASALFAWITGQSNLVFEAHSTDYQTKPNLRALVEDQFAILKVGPWLTFALREGLLGLAIIEATLMPQDHSHLFHVLENHMLEKPKYWQEHYHGTPDEQRVARVFSYSDRIRYYWAQPEVNACVEKMLANLSRQAIPLSLISQYLPEQYRKVRSGKLDADPHTLLLDKVKEVLADYAYATNPHQSKW